MLPRIREKNDTVADRSNGCPFFSSSCIRQKEKKAAESAGTEKDRIYMKL